MYLCKDGSMYGSLSGPTTSVAPGVTYVYGYWYTTNADGEDDFVIHLTGTQGSDGSIRATDPATGEDTDIHVFDTEHGDYSWEASFSLGLYGGFMTRNMNIYGQQYTPAQSLTVDASALGTFYTGDSLDPSALVVTAVRGTGSEESIWGGRLSFSGYDSDSAGTKTVTASFLGATATFEVNVEDLVADTYSGTYGMVVDNAVTDTEATMVVDYSHKTVTVASADGSVVETGTLVEAADDSVTITINGSEPIVATIADGTITVPAHQEVVAGWGESATYEVGGRHGTTAARRLDLPNFPGGAHPGLTVARRLLPLPCVLPPNLVERGSLLAARARGVCRRLRTPRRGRLERSSRLTPVTQVARWPIM